MYAVTTESGSKPEFAIQIIIGTAAISSMVPTVLSVPT
jgi:hypothetical protein